jgi:hypothetical protein
LTSQFEKWGKEPKFYTGCEPFDMMSEYIKNPKETIKNILLSAEFTNNADEECDKPIPKELRSTIGAIIFKYNNKKLFDKQYNELYNNFEPFRSVMDRMYGQINKTRQDLKEDVSELDSNPTNLTNLYLREFGPMLTPKDIEKIVKTGEEPAFVIQRDGKYAERANGALQRVLLSKNLDKVVNMQFLWVDNGTITFQPYFDPESDEVEYGDERSSAQI